MAIFAVSAWSATFYVTNNADNGPGTLRDALTQAAANGSASTDYIYFNLTDQTMAGRTIDLLTELPALSSNLVIDGTTQPGIPFYTTDARIFIRMMTYAARFSMLKVYNCTSVQIYGLYVYFGDLADAFYSRTHTLYGIDIAASSNIIIGAPGKGNVLNGEAVGIWSAGSVNLTHDITIQSNYIGCGLYPSATNDIDNTVILMDAGVHLQSVANITLGGPSAAAGNVICGMTGLWIGSAGATGNGPLLIQNNHFARSFDKVTPVRGYDGFTQYIEIGVTGSLQDYALQMLDNDISERVNIDNLTINFAIKRNTFGLCPDFEGVGDTKLLISDCSGGIIGGDDPADANHFLFGQYPGYSIHTANIGPLTMLKNEFECNSQYGSTTMSQYVDEPYDVPFVEVNQPSATVVSGTATPNCRIDLYYDDECTACEGKIYIGRTQSDGSGNWSYSGPVNGTVVATATNSTGRTGDFSAPLFFTGSMKIKNPSCGNMNGSITGITSDGAESFYWVNLRTGETVSHSIDLTNAGPGEYLLYGVHGGTCIKPIYGSIGLSDVTPHIQPANVHVTQPGCGQFNGSIIGISVSEYSNLRFAWINDQGQTVSNAQNLTGAGPGQYKLIVTDTVTGCSDQTGPYQLINQSGPTVDISQALVTGTVCRQSTGGISNILISDVTGQPVYTWIDAGGNPVGSGAMLQNVPAGAYQLLFKDQGSCPAIKTPPIIIPNTGGDVKLTVDQAATSDESCERRNASVQVQNISPDPAGFSFAWIDDGTGQSIGAGLSISNLAAGSYDFQATDASGCPQKVKTFQLTDEPGPSLDLSALAVKADTCAQDIGAITGIGVKGSASFNYTWYQSPAGSTIAATKDLTTIGKGSYYVKVVDRNNCSTTSAVFDVDNITPQLPKPVIDDPVILKGQSASFYVTNLLPGTYYLYPSDPDDGANSSPIQTNTTGVFKTSLLEADTTLYVVFRFGDCSSPAATVGIKVLPTQKLIVPNAFTPNEDGHNDLFRIKNPQLVHKFMMTLFNRWGEKVFETTNPYQGWDGVFHGHPEPTGTYVWIIHYTDIFGLTQSLQGTLVLVR